MTARPTAILARAHARTGDAAKIASYCGKTEALDEALADFAEAYGDQTEQDHAALLKAIKAGKVAAVEGVYRLLAAFAVLTQSGLLGSQKRDISPILRSSENCHL